MSFLKIFFGKTAEDLEQNRGDFKKMVNRKRQ